LSGLTVVSAELFDEPALTNLMHGCDVVFHLAAKVHAPAATPLEEFERSNVDATRSVMNAAVAASVPVFVFFSTVAVYPESDEIFDESSPTAPSTPYGVTKLAAEKIVLTEPNIRATVLRLPVVYGPRDRGNVRRLIEAIAKRRFVLPGTGRNIKTMVAVANVVEAAVHVATDQRAAGKIYIVADDKAPTLAEIAASISKALGIAQTPLRVPVAILQGAGFLADMMARVTGLNLPLSADQVDKLSANTRYSGERIRRELGVVLRTGLDDGMAAAVAGYKADTQKRVFR
jgi:nucleoside-diphosphate-sugar epimerase